MLNAKDSSNFFLHSSEGFLKTKNKMAFISRKKLKISPRGFQKSVDELCSTLRSEISSLYVQTLQYHKS